MQQQSQFQIALEEKRKVALAAIEEYVKAAEAEVASRGYKLQENAAIGILMSKFAHFVGEDVLEMAFYGLEDSNFHSEAAKVKQMIKELQES